jgi:hypothetical protein
LTNGFLTTYSPSKLNFFPSKSIFNRIIIKKVYNPIRGGGFVFGLFGGEGVEKSFVGLMSIGLEGVGIGP